MQSVCNLPEVSPRNMSYRIQPFSIVVNACMQEHVVTLVSLAALPARIVILACAMTRHLRCASPAVPQTSLAVLVMSAVRLKIPAPWVIASHPARRLTVAMLGKPAAMREMREAAVLVPSASRT